MWPPKTLASINVHVINLLKVEFVLSASTHQLVQSCFRNPITSVSQGVEPKQQSAFEFLGPQHKSTVSLAFLPTADCGFRTQSPASYVNLL